MKSYIFLCIMSCSVGMFAAGDQSFIEEKLDDESYTTVEDAWNAAQYYSFKEVKARLKERYSLSEVSIKIIEKSLPFFTENRKRNFRALKERIVPFLAFAAIYEPIDESSDDEYSGDQAIALGVYDVIAYPQRGLAYSLPLGEDDGLFEIDGRKIQV